ncbi:conserved hypothetical protein [Mesorhizobium metallidurans STM 2683]|uniref:DUF551 domain-containing protein n=2 Tax=Mesorhizobium metallidurans TaxID=489722 RepID=M5EMB4_9HYPH|nr:conserved hypothetical protein [Mesorhizobium metallidurans STM 2683]
MEPGVLPGVPSVHGGDEMAARQPIETAPKDGSKVTVYWKDSNGVINESIAQYRDAGWWTYIDSDTQKRVEPTSWRPTSEDSDDE